VTLHPLSQAGVFIYSSCGKWVFPPLLWSFPSTATFTSFPAPDCWVCAATPAFSGLACLFTAHMECGSSSLSCGVFLPLSLLQAFLILVAGHVLPLLCFSGQLVYLQFCEGFLSPPLVLSAPHPLCYMSFFFVIAYYSVFLFTLGGGQSVQGAMLIWPRVVCGGIVYCLAHLVVCIFPRCLGVGVCRHPGGPPGFSV
jgi:hypothetical protein